MGGFAEGLTAYVQQSAASKEPLEAIDLTQESKVFLEDSSREYCGSMRDAAKSYHLPASIAVTKIFIFKYVFLDFMFLGLL